MRHIKCLTNDGDGKGDHKDAADGAHGAAEAAQGRLRGDVTVSNLVILVSASPTSRNFGHRTQENCARFLETDKRTNLESASVLKWPKQTEL